MIGKKFVIALFALAAAFGLGACGGGADSGHEKSLIIIGIDGMDWDYTQRMISQGQLPHFAELMIEGHGQSLETSVPPLSPIAWSDFITGMDSGGHGIFDFIHRDPETYFPYSAMAETEGDTEPLIKFGKYQIPSGGDVRLLRRGTPFWSVLEGAGVPTWIYRMPVNFPPSGTATRELSGMGTPDFVGTLGTANFWTTALFFDQDVDGVEVQGLDFWEDRATGSVLGPPNPFRVDGERLESPLVVTFDPESDVVEVEVGEEPGVVLQPGEWSDWVTVTFEMIPTQAITATTRFYLRSVRPEVELYASPLQIDPKAPVMPISTPSDHAAKLAAATGEFFTQGMPEDTKALTEEVITRDEFLSQAEVAHQELVDQFEYLLPQFQGGTFFYYFGNLDQVSHIMWGVTDPEHPTYNPETAAKYADVVPNLYREADRIVGYALDHLPEGATLIVMSDHGFASWRRSFNLNSWLRDEGYLVAKDPNLVSDPGFFRNVDWSQTQAFGAGFNGLYANQRGRESQGIVDPLVADELLAEIGEKLLAATDPETGDPIVTRIYKADEFFNNRGALEVGPDMLVGYAKGVRTDSDGALGTLSPDYMFDNIGNWTGDHSMDHTTVPGVFFANRKLETEVVSLRDLATAVVAEFGAGAFPQESDAH